MVMQTQLTQYEENMTAQILDGKRVAGEIRAEVATSVQQYVDAGAPAPCLTAVLVGEDPASQVYVRNKSRACEKAGIDGRTHRLPAAAGQEELLRLIADLNCRYQRQRNFGSAPAASRCRDSVR